MSGSTTVGDHRETTTPTTVIDDRENRKWQKKLLPFMTRMVSALTLFFFLASFGQLIYLHLNIQKSPALQINDSFSQLPPPGSLTTQQAIESSKLKALILLEGNSLDRQYHQANVLLMARVWTSYLGFVTGMVLALVGAAFILGKLRESSTELSSALQAASISLKSASPGLVLAVLGTTLMLATIITHHQIEVVDKAVYLHDVPTSSTSTTSTPPPLDAPKLKTDTGEIGSRPVPTLQPPVQKTESTAVAPAGTPPPLNRPSPVVSKPSAISEQPPLKQPTPKSEVTP